MTAPLVPAPSVLAALVPGEAVIGFVGLGNVGGKLAASVLTGFTAEMVDDEPEEPGAEVIVRR